MSIIAYQYEADRHCVSCAVRRFGFTADRPEGAGWVATLRMPGVRYSDTDPMLDEHGIPCMPYPEDREGNPISGLSSDLEWCNLDNCNFCRMYCGTCASYITGHAPSDHGYCDCGDGCSEGECSSCGDDDDEEYPDDPSYEDSTEPAFGCNCDSCEAAAAYVLGEDDTESVEQFVLPFSAGEPDSDEAIVATRERLLQAQAVGDVCAICGLITGAGCSHGFEPMQDNEPTVRRRLCSDCWLDANTTSLGQLINEALFEVCDSCGYHAYTIPA